MATLLFDGLETQIDDGAPRGGGLWIEAGALPAATGFELAPEGLCRGALCVPLVGPERERLRDGSRVDVAALAERLRRPVVRDDARGVWSVGPEPGSRLAESVAPDFTLPDFEGRQHSLSQYRGKKVLILSWASW
jgi:hypothetical protein